MRLAGAIRVPAAILCEERGADRPALGIPEGTTVELTEYLNLETLQQLQDAFTAVSQRAVRVCGPDGRPLTAPSTVEADEEAVKGPVQESDSTRANVPIMVRDQIIGRVMLDAAPGGEMAEVFPRHVRLIGLVTGVIARLCQREQQLRTRVDELVTLYRLTGEFTTERDLEELMDLVAATVVETMGAKGCSLRLLNEEGTELVMEAVAGLSSEYINKGPILLDESKIDQEVLSTGEVVYMEDMQTDPRVLYPEEARREGIVSGLCAPMIYKSRPEGAIRVYMAERREFDWFEVSLLKAIASEAAAAIVNARLYSEAVRSANIQRQLRLAGEVQRRMIPDELPAVPGLDIAAIYVPCFELGGDFYDFIRLPSDNLGVAVCDVVGKGVRASLLMASIRAALRAHALNIYDISEILTKVNRDLCIDTLSSDFATLFYGVIDLRSKRFTYANAGHTPPMLVRDGKVRYLQTGGVVLGIDTDLSWSQEVVSLRSGDVIFAHTDGLHEAMNFDDEPFGRARVEAAVLAAIEQQQTSAPGVTASGVGGIAKHVLWEMRRFAGLQTRPDDLTLIAIKVE